MRRFIRKDKTVDYQEVMKTAAEAAFDKKSTRLVGLDLRGHSDICDWQLICSGENDRQTRAIADSIEDALRKKWNLRPVAIEGKQSGHWVLIDYGTIMIHVFFDYLRDYYGLEELFSKAKFIDFKAPAPIAAKPVQA